jgi:hypothetical protein
MKTCVLIQTCDKYDHLWEGLKLSYHLNWCWDINLPIYILTEDKVFPYDKFNTLNFGFFGHEGNPIKNFSTRMISALEHLKSLGFDSILYTQDDFWPLFKVEKKVFDETLRFLENDIVDCIHINEYLPWYNYNLSKTNHYINDIRVNKFEFPSSFYYNHQSAFWKINSLLRIQNKDEEPYENECKGTERAWISKPNYYFLNYSWYKPEFINDKGKLLPVAQSFVRDWNFNIKYNLNNNE